jgi:sigma-E factor negative regulatory protein RseB
MQIWCYLPGRNMGVHEYRKVSDRAFPSILPEQVGMLSRNYHFKFGDDDRIADRAARIILVRPKDHFRYGYRLWADRQSGLLLKADLVDENEKAIEQYMFTQIEIGKVLDDSLLKPHTPKQDLLWHGEKPTTQKQIVKSNTWIAGEMPSGYKLTSSMQRMIPVRDMPVHHLVYSDGVATVSVFIEKRDAKSATKVMRGTSRMGAVHAFGKALGEYQVTVVGEVPAATVEMIGESVRRK